MVLLFFIMLSILVLVISKLLISPLLLLLVINEVDFLNLKHKIMKNFISKAQFLAKKELSNRSLELANFEASLNKSCPKSNKRTMLNHMSPNVRVARGYCKSIES